MKSVALAISFIGIICPALAQNFSANSEVPLPDTVTAEHGEWIDVNNDGLLDIALFAKSDAGDNYLMFVKGDTVNGPALSTSKAPLPDYSSFAFEDYDHDNQLDLILSVKESGVRKSMVLRNKGGFSFESVATSLPYFDIIAFADLDQDANQECIISGEDDYGNYFTRTYKRSSDVWSVAADSLNIRLSALEITDFNHDGFEDLFISGTYKTGETISAMLERDGKWFKMKVKNNALLKTFLCDVNTDGFMDIAGLGISGGTPVYQIFSSSPTYAVTSRTATNVNDVFLADIDIDGQIDELKLDINTIDTVNRINYSSGGSELLPHRKLLKQKFGDLEHDGDLDLFQLIDRTSHQSIVILRNKLKNEGPAKPLALAIPVYDYLFLWWDAAPDDHTPTGSITYDVLLESNIGGQSAAFDLSNEKRLAVRHGNNGTDNFRILKVEGTLNYSVQAIDNAYHAGAACTGSGTACVDNGDQVVKLCTKEKATFTAASSALWFSLKDGFLGKGSTLSYEAGSKADTVFSFTPSQSGCAKIAGYRVEINNEVKQEPGETIYTCSGTPTNLAIQSDWASVNWTSTKKGALGNGTAIQFQTDQNDVVTVNYENDLGCKIQKQFTILLSVPVITVTPTSSKIMRGQSVTLSATGATSYVWSPSTGLSNPNISNPSASPASDTQYTVTGYDSLGCTASATATVTVDASGFVATLFSPNGDGKNDALKVYGVSGAETFSFRIYNREGKIVYKTDDLSEALSVGWDGTVNGVSQPNGVYFWKVQGESRQGTKLLLNGQNEGSVVLLR